MKSKLFIAFAVLTAAFAIGLLVRTYMVTSDSEATGALSLAGDCLNNTGCSSLNIAKGNFHNLLKLMPEILASSNDALIIECEIKIKETLYGLSAAQCSEALSSEHWYGWGVFLDEALAKAADDKQRASIIERYYLISSELADLWQQTGNMFKAADADLATYRVLTRRRVSHPQLKDVITRYIEKWKLEKCDNDASNFSIAHRNAEKIFHDKFEDEARNNPKILKAISSWYRYHYDRATRILGHPPAW